MEDAEELKAKLTRKRKKEPGTLSTKDLLSTGSTLLNLACSGKARGGFPKGKYVFLVGDSASGKTFLALTCLAEAAKNKHFEGYRFIHDNGEDGALMNIEEYFGKAVAERIEPPSMGRDDIPVYSETIEELYFHLDDAIEEGRPFIYIQDSMDVLSSEEDNTKFQERKKAYRKGKEASGSYAMSKAKLNSMNIRRVLAGLRKTGSILIIISQTRDNVQPFGFEKKTRAGGHALRFYAALELWSSIKGKIKKTVKGKERQLGILGQVKLVKNRLTGKLRTVEMPILHSTGIDDVKSCIDYLIEEKHWSKDGSGNINASEFHFKGTEAKLIQKVEEEGLERELQDIVSEVWNEIEEACTPKRKKRYE